MCLNSPAMALLMRPAPPPLLFTSIWLKNYGLDRGLYLRLIIHTCEYIQTCVYVTVMIPSGHMTSILLSSLERGPPLLLS